MKILFLTMAKLRYIPYVNFYLDQIDKEKNEIHIIYWDRDGEPDISLDNRYKLYCYRDDLVDSIPLKNKLPHLYGYRKFAQKVIKILKPDFLVVHYSTTAVLLLDSLILKYRKRYIFDFRDITYEKYAFFRTLVALIQKGAVATFSSSEGFIKYLPIKKDVYNSHNVEMNEYVPKTVYVFPKEIKDRIRIGYWGLIRAYTPNRAIIEKLGDDPRFELHYYGRAQGKMLELMEWGMDTYKNVFYHGVYSPEERFGFARNTDLINNVFEADQKTMSLAMSNKFYDGIAFCIPQICTKESVMGKRVEDVGIGMAVDPMTDSLGNDLYYYYNGIKAEQFMQNCKAEKERIDHEMEEAKAIIARFLN